jgi:hypothetical protein
MKNYFKILSIGLLMSITFSSCSDEFKKSDETKGILQRSSESSSALAATICDITGATITTSGTAIVGAGSTTVYNYTNNTGIPAVVTWTVQTANPAGSITITGSGASVSVSYAANFISGSITANGTGGSAQPCQSLLNITASGGTGGNCCAPIMTMSFVCRGSSSTGNLGGFITIKSPLNCNVNWSNVSKIDMRIEGGPKFSSDSSLNGLKVGTLYGPFNGTVNEEFYYAGCLARVTCKATVYYKSGCAAVSINAEALKQ